MSKPTRTPEQARVYMAGYRALHRDRIRALTRASAARRREADPVSFMLSNARTRAKKRGQPCTITRADVVIPERCPLLGLSLARNSGVLGPDSPSLDRKDPALGYVPGNVWVISHRANSMKNDARPDELIGFARAVLEVFDAPD